MSALILAFLLIGAAMSGYTVGRARRERLRQALHRHPSNLTSYPRIDRGEWV